MQSQLPDMLQRTWIQNIGKNKAFGERLPQLPHLFLPLQQRALKTIKWGVLPDIPAGKRVSQGTVDNQVFLRSLHRCMAVQGSRLFYLFLFEGGH